MKLRNLMIAGIAALSVGGVALAQVPGTIVIKSLVGAFSVPIATKGPQSAILPLNGGTFACAGSAATVANSAVDAGSSIWITLKTVGGTVAAPYVNTITPGTGFHVTCGSSDTSTYNYVIVG
jgi:hypothetical protein